MDRVLSVGIIGIGAMGSCYAGRMLAAGHGVSLLPNRKTPMVADLIGSGARVVGSAAELAERCDLVLAALPDVPQVQQVLFGDAGLVMCGSRQSEDALLFIDLSTITPGAAEDHHSRLAQFGIAALDAPVSGGPTRAADGTLTIMVGGDPAAFERALPVLNTLGNHVVHVGPPGTGQAVKLVNQLIISSIMVANAEALSLGVGAGIPLPTLLDVVGRSSGSNYLLTDWMPRTLFAGELESGFALDLLMKDLRAALRWAQERQSPVFAGAIAEQLYRLVRTDANARHDYSTVARLFEAANDVELRLHPEGD